MNYTSIINQTKKVISRLEEISNSNGRNSLPVVVVTAKGETEQQGIARVFGDGDIPSTLIIIPSNGRENY